MTYPRLKAFRVLFVVSRFAGLSHLPRLFVDRAVVGSKRASEHLLIMEFESFRCMTPLVMLEPF